MLNSPTRQWIAEILAARPAILTCPSSFDGPLPDFHTQYVLPNLLDPSMVQYYHELLMEHCSSDGLLPIVRAVSGTEKWRISEPARQKVYVTRFGDRFKATDNAPSWWMYQVVATGLRIPRTCFADVLLEMPMHMFDVGKRLNLSVNINAKGWHVAHLNDAKDGDTGYENWDRQNLVRRFIRNLHPCNLFYMPKLKPQTYGGGLDEKSFYYEVLSTRYASVWQEFTALAAGSRPPQGSSTARIIYDQRLGGPWYSLIDRSDDPFDATSLPPQAQKCLQLMALGGKSRYSKSELIEEFEKHRNVFRTVQEPWKIFSFYKERLDKLGLIRTEIV
jgi:hypothetical protein